jgi:hypothetical protein
MAASIYLANDGNDRLIISTTCNHLVFFHEAGFEFRTERKMRTRFMWWNPTTWRGFKWTRSDDVQQPVNIRCTFNESFDPVEFGATSQSSLGRFNLSCDHLTIRRHCVWVVRDAPARAEPAGGDGARDVREILLRFEYDGQKRTVRHTTGAKLRAIR